MTIEVRNYREKKNIRDELWKITDNPRSSKGAMVRIKIKSFNFIYYKNIIKSLFYNKINKIMYPVKRKMYMFSGYFDFQSGPYGDFVNIILLRYHILTVAINKYSMGTALIRLIR